MVQLEPVMIDNQLCTGISVTLPQTTVLVITTQYGYLMCGLIDVERLDRLHPEREVVAARVTGVRKIQDLLTAKVDALSRAAAARGISLGMTGKEAIAMML